MRCRPLSIFIIRCIVPFPSLVLFLFLWLLSMFVPAVSIYIFFFSRKNNDNDNDDDNPPRNSTSRRLVTERAGEDWNFRVFATLICYILCSLLSLIFPPHFLVFLPSLKLWVLPLGVWRCICFTNGHRHFLTQETLEVEIFLSKLLLQIVTLEVPSLGIIILLLIHECDDSRDRIVIYIPSVCS